MDGEETLLEAEAEVDSGSYAVTVEGLDSGAPTVRVEWTCFAPSDDLVLAVLDRAAVQHATAAAREARATETGGRTIITQPSLGVTTTNGPAVINPPPGSAW